MPTLQEWLNNKYADKQTKTIDLSNLKDITEEGGTLEIKGFSNLKKIISNKPIYKIKKIIIDDCPNLKEVYLHSFTNNKELTITNCSELKTLDCSDGQQLFDIRNEKDKRYEELQKAMIYQEHKTVTEQTLKDIANSFAQERLVDKTVEPQKNFTVELHLSARDKISVAGENTVAFTRWKNGSNNTIFEIYLRNNLSSEKTFYLLAHELAHNVIMLKERTDANNRLPSSQQHSQAFWETFLEGDNSTLSFVRSKLDKIRQARLDIYLRVAGPNLISASDTTSARWVYFPNLGGDLENKIRRKKYFQSGEDADKEWKDIRREVLQLANDSMNNPPDQAETKWVDWRQEQNGQKREVNEKNKRWIQVEVQPVKPSEANNPKKGKYKIYVFYNNGSEDKGQEFAVPADLVIPDDLKTGLDRILSERGWPPTEKGISKEKAKKISEKQERIKNESQSELAFEAQIEDHSK